jgi:aldehyde dehydrogenase (NAD+)
MSTPYQSTSLSMGLEVMSPVETDLALTSPTQIAGLVQGQRAFFAAGHTRSLPFRRQQLCNLKQAILSHEREIIAAVQADLGRSEFEAYFELAILKEIDLALKQIHRWVKPRRVAVPFEHLPATAWTEPQPLGVVLIIAPWNYPFQLLISPLIGAIAAGNGAILKPSELAPHTAQLVAQLIATTFDPTYVAVVQGGVETSQALLAQKFDHIFFTGSPAVGKLVMAAAAPHLTPVTLELGEKAPVLWMQKLTWSQHSGGLCGASSSMQVKLVLLPIISW